MPRPARKPLRLNRASGRPSKKISTDAEAWVRRTLRKMTLEEKVGQLVMIPFFGQFTSTESHEFQELAHAVERQHIGGLVVHTRAGALGLERSRAYPTAALANLLQARARIPLLIGADFERGTAMRLEEGTSFPHAMAVAAAGSPADAYATGRITAIEARSVGVQWIFAPVADVNSNPENPIINVRSFGENAKRVAEFVAAYVRGVEENGALATAKHFPGHGDTDVDSHLALPTVRSDRAHMDSVELLPFRAAIAAGVSTIMTGHLAVPALEPDPELPTTFSKKITTDLLRKRMGFGKLIVTDDLSMGGVAAQYPTGETAVRSMLAGSDVLLVFAHLNAALTGLRDAAESGRLPMARIDEAVTQILRAKAHVNLHKRKRASLEALPKSLGASEFARAAADIADRGVTLLRDTSGLLPLDATRPTRMLLVAVAGDPDPSPGQALEQELRWRVDSLQVARADTRFAKIDAIQLPPPDTYDAMVVALFVRVADRKGSVGLPDDQTTFVQRLLRSEKPTLVACFGNPYVVARFPEAKTWLAAFSSADVAQRAAGRALFGQIAVGGRIPVSVPGVVARGAGLDVAASSMTLVTATTDAQAKLAPAYELLDQAVTDGAFPGGVLAVANRGQLSVHAFGKHTYEKGAAVVTAHTLYDAASLTKPVVTATLAAMLVEAGSLDLDAPLTRYLPEWSAGPAPLWRARTTARHLLTHTSGLSAHEEFFKKLRSRREIIAQAMMAPLACEPGAQSVYSDLGFILMGDILERLTGRRVDQLATERIFAPLGMTDTLFLPPKSLRARIAPTERDTTFRKRLLRGEVHDENAWVMGGAAGHAGMFSTARDLAAFCQMLLNGGVYAHRRLLRRSTVAQFTSPSALAPKECTLGWMIPTSKSSSGRHFSSHAFGQLGFTGTSLWLDPDRQLFVVLLTNRVHPTRDNDKIHRVRPALHDAVLEALGFAGRRPSP